MVALIVEEQFPLSFLSTWYAKKPVLLLPFLRTPLPRLPDAPRLCRLLVAPVLYHVVVYINHPFPLASCWLYFYIGGSSWSRRGRGTGGRSNYDSPPPPGPVPTSGHYTTLGIKSTATTAEVGRSLQAMGRQEGAIVEAEERNVATKHVCYSYAVVFGGYSRGAQPTYLVWRNKRMDDDRVRAHPCETSPGPVGGNTAYISLLPGIARSMV